MRLLERSIRVSQLAPHACLRALRMGAYGQPTAQTGGHHGPHQSCGPRADHVSLLSRSELQVQRIGPGSCLSTDVGASDD
jgi:hypothetical protein